MRRIPAKGEMDEAGQAAVARLVSIWRDTRNKYANGGSFLYCAFTASDAMYAPLVTRFETFKVDGIDEVRDYMEAVVSLIGPGL
jgi:glutathione S-transferase